MQDKLTQIHSSRCPKDQNPTFVFDNIQTLKIAQKRKKYDLKVLEKTYWDVKKCRESKGDVLFAPAGLEIKLLAKNDDTTKSSLWDLGLNY